MTGYDEFTPLPPRERRTVRSADGTGINVEFYGADDAPTVVLSHGWTCSIAFWVQQIRDLAADHRVVAYDHRGHGGSDMPGPAGYSAAGLADDLSAVLRDALPEGERAVLAGHSMGGMTMIAFAGRHPGQLRRQVAGGVFASTGMSELMPRSRVVPMPLTIARLTVPISTWVIGQPQRGVNPLSRFLLRYASLSGSATPAEVDFCARIVQACPPRTRRGFALMLSRLDLAGDVGDFDLPAIVVAGVRDRLTPVWHTRRLAAALPRLIEDVELDGIGHMTPVQSPGVVNTAIRRLTDGSRRGAVLDLTGQRLDLDAGSSRQVS